MTAPDKPPRLTPEESAAYARDLWRRNLDAIEARAAHPDARAAVRIARKALAEVERLYATDGESARIADGERAAHEIAVALRGHGVPGEAAEGLALTLACFVADETRTGGGNSAGIVAALERLAATLRGAA